MKTIPSFIIHMRILQLWMMHIQMHLKDFAIHHGLFFIKEILKIDYFFDDSSKVINLLKEKGVGIVGARNCSTQALQNTDRIVQRLQSKYVIVSGLAKGIDARAHYNATKTIGVLGCGINVIYPKENTYLFERMKNNGLIISEYPMHVKPLAYHFPWRNRLIAALSDSLVVIEAAYKSGTMITVNECLELSVPIYCVPTAFQDEKHQGCNYLISNGANILVDIKDVDDI